MIVGGVHWFVATAIAVSIHLAGMLWLSLPMHTQERPELEPAGEGIVVTLGGGARTLAARVDPVETESAGAPAEVGQVTPDRADSVVEALEPVPEASELVSEASDPVPEASDPVPEAPARAEAAPASPDPEALDAAPESGATPEVTETAAVKPEAVESGDVNEVALLESETVTARAVSSVSPEPETIDPQAPAATIPRTSRPAAVVPDVAEDVAFPDTRVEVQETSPDAQVVPERPQAAVKRDEPLADVPDPGAMEAIVTDGVRQREVVPQSEAVQADPAKQAQQVTAGETVTAARQPAEVEQVEDIGQEARPVTIDLEELEGDAGGRGVTARYAGVIKGWLQKNMHYPRAARLAGQEGEVVVRFVIDRMGNVQSITLESRSGYPLLDREAREMIERGDPFPPIPEEMPGQTLEVRVPASFHVRDETLTKEIPPIILE